MTVEEAKEKRHHVESAIRAGLAQFEKETGLRVYDVHIMRVDTCGEQKEPPLVELEVRL